MNERVAAIACDGGGRLRSQAGRLYTDENKTIGAVLFAGQTVAFEARALPRPDQVRVVFGVVGAPLPGGQ